MRHSSLIIVDNGGGQTGGGKRTVFDLPCIRARNVAPHRATTEKPPKRNRETSPPSPSLTANQTAVTCALSDEGPLLNHAAKPSTCSTVPHRHTSRTLVKRGTWQVWRQSPARKATAASFGERSSRLRLASRWSVRHPSNIIRRVLNGLIAGVITMLFRT